LFVNAGIGEFRPLDQWGGVDRSFSVGLTGPFFLIEALLALFANPASIVLNTLINTHVGIPHSSFYALTKAALLAAGARLRARSSAAHRRQRGQPRTGRHSASR
jgi:NAD(P)-dependent dehydrogenase (short-subunit alcohol dehydrogenase family)